MEFNLIAELSTTSITVLFEAKGITLDIMSASILPITTTLSTVLGLDAYKYSIVRSVGGS